MSKFVIMHDNGAISHYDTEQYEREIIDGVKNPRPVPLDVDKTVAKLIARCGPGRTMTLEEWHNCPECAERKLNSEKNKKKIKAMEQAKDLATFASDADRVIIKEDMDIIYADIDSKTKEELDVYDPKDKNKWRKL